MKKTLIALALMAVCVAAGAQVKTSAEAKKMVDSAIEATKNEKKAAKAGTWINLGKAYMAAYDAPIGEVWQWASKQELMLTMKEQAQSAQSVQLADGPYLKEVYSEKNLYFNQNGQLAVIEVTKPVLDDPLTKAVEAYSKAYSIDPKKAKDVTAAITSIAGKLTNDAYAQYTLGNVAKASELFEKAADAVAIPPLNQLDTNSLYNAGFTAQAVGDRARAKKFLERCYEAGYYAEGGEVFARLADLDTTKTRDYLEEGFTKYPQSQAILIGLINYYMKSEGNTDRLFELLDMAKANEPNNPSLYYVEGNIRTELGDIDKAVEAYRKCAEISPEYEYGYIGEGIMFYNKAVEYQDLANNEYDDAKYMALVAKFEESLKNCIAPFEKAFEITPDNSIKVSVAEYLKNACFRFRDESPEYQTKYEKYDAIVKSGQAE
ncbi:MAG: hypothetical protein IJ795_01265 [Bacteroidales bacterium]|nr:hypothetical protein [Bacteroidales bacterium]